MRGTCCFCRNAPPCVMNQCGGTVHGVGVPPCASGHRGVMQRAHGTGSVAVVQINPGILAPDAAAEADVVPTIRVHEPGSVRAVPNENPADTCSSLMAARSAAREMRRSPSSRTPSGNNAEDDAAYHERMRQQQLQVRRPSGPRRSVRGSRCSLRTRGTISYRAAVAGGNPGKLSSRGSVRPDTTEPVWTVKDMAWAWGLGSFHIPTRNTGAPHPTKKAAARAALKAKLAAENARVQQLEGQLEALARSSTSPPGRAEGSASPADSAPLARDGTADEGRDTVSAMGGAAARLSKRFSTVSPDCFDEGDDDDDVPFVLQQQHTLTRAARNATGHGASGRYGF
eukprot:m.409036 g.409036  ORF g.409036 m.409036 type:complete len:341 (+) comp21241_c1_seq1:98-1120(+)